MRAVPALLTDRIAQELDAAVPSGVMEMSEAVRLPESRRVAAVLFYGSGLWQSVGEDTVLDFYVLVDSYRAYHGRLLPAVLNRLVPPSVFYLEQETSEGPRRAKVSVMQLDQFAQAAAGRTWTPQIWARFAQPCRACYLRDSTARRQVVAALASCAETFHRHALPLVGDRPSEAEIWSRGLSETYSRELRSETTARADAVYAAVGESCVVRTRALALAGTIPLRIETDGFLAVTLPAGARRRAALMAPVRRAYGKAVCLLRLMKAAFTFEGGADYILWKIERHSGVRVEASPFQRRHPLLGGWGLLWRLYRRGAFR